jgi:hypothetical protein
MTIYSFILYITELPCFEKPAITDWTGLVVNQLRFWLLAAEEVQPVDRSSDQQTSLLVSGLGQIGQWTDLATGLEQIYCKWLV